LDAQFTIVEITLVQGSAKAITLVMLMVAPSRVQ